MDNNAQLIVSTFTTGNLCTLIIAEDTLIIVEDAEHEYIFKNKLAKIIAKAISTPK